MDTFQAHYADSHEPGWEPRIAAQLRERGLVTLSGITGAALACWVHPSGRPRARFNDRRDLCTAAQQRIFLATQARWRCSEAPDHSQSIGHRLAFRVDKYRLKQANGYQSFVLSIHAVPGFVGQFF